MSLCLCESLCDSVVKLFLRHFHHRDTEDAQRHGGKLRLGHHSDSGLDLPTQRLKAKVRDHATALAGE